MRVRFPWPLPALALLAACSATKPAAVPASAILPAELASTLAATAETPGGTPSFENLHAALWTADAVEFRAVANQAYRLARLALDRALEDTSWTAALEQEAPFGAKPPAVVLDVDETVLDNMAYQARLILDRGTYDPATWAAWVEEAAAGAIPGALEFTRYAASRGVRVVYLTNRDAAGEAATRRNLEALGFPLTDDPDDVMTQNERPEWRASDKGPRRAWVAGRYRVVQLVGDNLGDFLSERRADFAGRESLYAAHDDWWGERWIVLPNPQYGSWESAAFSNDFSLTPAQRTGRKLERIRLRAGR